MSEVLVRERDLSLRGMRAGDLSLLSTWRRAPHVRAFWDNDDDDSELGADFVDRHYRPLLDAESDTTATIIEVGGTPVGYLQFYLWSSCEEAARAMSIPLDDRAFGLDVFLGDPAHVGRGVGARAVDLACRHLFDTLGASRIALLTSIDNVRAQRAYEKAGFARAREALDVDTRGGVRIASWLMVRERAR